MLTLQKKKQIQRKLWKIVQKSDLISELEDYFVLLGAEVVKDILNFVHSASGDTLAHQIARHNRWKILEFLHKNYHLHLEKANLDGKEPLHEAASFGSLQVATYLLVEGGVKVDPLKRAGWTPLMMAANRFDNLLMIQFLVENGARIDLCNKDGWNTFHVSCRTGNLEIVRFLYNLGSSVLSNISTNGRTPLHTAALHGNTEVVNFIKKHQEKLFSIKDNCGSYPLMDAVRSDNISTTEACLAAQPQYLLAVNKTGQNCLHIAAEANSCRVIEYLVEKKLLDVNIQVDEITSKFHGQNSLHIAYLNNNQQSVETSKLLGINQELKDCLGRFPHEVSLKKIWNQ